MKNIYNFAEVKNVDMIKQLFDFYLEHQQDLVKKYNGKYLVITEAGVAGVLDDDTAAYRFGKQHFGLGNFIMQLCTPGPEAYTFYDHHIA